MSNAVVSTVTRSEIEPSLSFLETLDRQNVGAEKVLVEFRFPGADANTWVLARRHWKGGVEVGMPIESRGGKVYNFQRLETTQFNLSRCTGYIRPYLALAY
jgi:hypothetical protein